MGIPGLRKKQNVTLTQQQQTSGGVLTTVLFVSTVLFHASNDDLVARITHPYITNYTVTNTLRYPNTNRINHYTRQLKSILIIHSLSQKFPVWSDKNSASGAISMKLCVLILAFFVNTHANLFQCSTCICRSLTVVLGKGV